MAVEDEQPQLLNYDEDHGLQLPASAVGTKGINKPFAKRLNQILYGNPVDDELVQTFNILLDFVKLDDIEPASRLFSKIEGRTIEANQKILDHYALLLDDLDDTASRILSLSAKASAMRSSALAVTRQLGPIIRQGEKLKEQKAASVLRRNITKAFEKTFTLEDEMLNVLLSRKVNEEYFKVLDTVKTIHERCQLLLITEDQDAGHEIMHEMSRYLEACYHTLQSWFFEQLKNLPYDVSEINPLVKHCVRELRFKPTVLRNCIQEYSQLRSDAAIREFMSALNGEGGVVQRSPLELSAHDPQRHVGDLLAWLHQAVATERDVTNTIFDWHKETLISDAQHHILPVEEDEVSIIHIIDENLAAVCRALKSRIDYVSSVQTKPVQIFQMAMLLQFYILILRKLLYDDGLILETINRIYEQLLERFFLLCDEMSNELNNVKIDENLHVPQDVQSAMHGLDRILTSLESAMPQSTNTDILVSQIMTKYLGPLMEACDKTSQALQLKERLIMLLNCDSLSLTMLSKYPLCANEHNKIERRIQSNMNSLIEHEATFYIDCVGLQPLLAKMANEDFDVISFDSKLIKNLANAIDKFLLLDLRSRLHKLQSTQLISTIHVQAVERFLLVFNQVEKKISICSENLQAEFPRTTVELRLLLGVE